MPVKAALREGENRPRGRSLRSKILGAIWATSKGWKIGEAQLYEIASAAAGRVLQRGFGLSTLEWDELVKVLEAVKLAAGLPVDQRRAVSPGPRRRNRLPLRADGGGRASLGQYRLMTDLREELGLAPEEFEGVAVRATGKPHSVASRDIGKVIEALKAIRLRRLRGVGGRGFDKPMPPKETAARGSPSEG